MKGNPPVNDKTKQISISKGLEKTITDFPATWILSKHTPLQFLIFLSNLSTQEDSMFGGTYKNYSLKGKRGFALT
jgi:hypothetical protein